MKYLLLLDMQEMNGRHAIVMNERYAMMMKKNYKEEYRRIY